MSIKETPVLAWWRAFNAALAAAGQPATTAGEAHRHYVHGPSDPGAAVRLLTAQREEDAP